jgi:hypothetical protein
MTKEAVFGSRMSGWIAGLYWGILIFLGAVLIGVPLLAGMTLLEGSIFSVVFAFIIIIFICILASAYRMSFVIAKDEIIIRGVFRTSRIRKNEIKSVQKTPIPTGFRLFGASFLGGWYYLPGIGTAWVAMTNFSDGVLITTKQGKHFVITPVNPEKFIKLAGGRK